MNQAPLKDFAALKTALDRTRREAEAQRQREQQAQQRALRAGHEAFAAAVGPVHAVSARGRAMIDRPKPDPLPRQREADEQAALQQALSDDVDIESLLLTDDGLSYRRPGIGPDVAARLRRGQWAIQAQIDLHGLRRDEAREALSEFIRRSHAQGRRCLRVVHGKGHGSPGREPVLKAKVQRWLAQSAEVVAFAQASAPQGGAGALIVLLAG
jgi:DNA-nicking Smr family endonuclease